MINTNSKKGFTLLELLIVIAVIAILSVILVIVLNPAETLAKSRDAQRIADLNTLKTAMGIYITSVASPLLDNTSGNTLCTGGSGTDSIWISVPSSTTSITDTGYPTGFGAFIQPASIATSSLVDGNGWIPVNFGSITGGSPISNLPLDPTNTITDGSALDNGDLDYRYACKASPLSFEVNATLESTAYVTTDPKMTKDGGNNSSLLEVGTDLSILPNENTY